MSDATKRLPGRVVTEATAAIAALVAEGTLKPGDRLLAQRLADRLGISRFPIGQAMRILAERGLLTADPGRGFSVATDGPCHAASFRAERGGGDLASAYFRIAEDRLSGALPEHISEQAMRDRYGLGRGQLAQLLNRMAGEGWAERRPGYGWRFSAVLTTPAALEQSYRLRLAIEPASLLEPGYRLDGNLLRQCREVELRMLDGEIETASADTLYERGVRFHEAIVGASGNPFFLDTLKRVNRIRRLLVYRSLADRSRYRQQAAEHLELLATLERGAQAEAAALLRAHLQGVMEKLSAVRPLLEAKSHPEG
ncbi:GntR family transcriptional regulator [Roseomonas populi]|uniref:GntR family transcriptional regulator n=1 Tax=Roseomonas populi TaxID=3121582 RepID=A0ABT1X3I1_9PROT|nr:GntR family transcriptional regulator [Roseomonas pecuniae]MCR0982661.1 GntR family transcriptional regulator [Roseomonas pecuniae]